MKYQLSRTIALMFFISTSLDARVLTGEGYGDTPEIAKHTAFSSISEQLRVNVKSVYESEHRSDGYVNASKKVKAISDVPLLGVKSTISNKPDGYYCVATLDSNESLSIYRTELGNLMKKIKVVHDSIDLQKDAQRYASYDKLLPYLEQYEKLAMVVRYFGVDDLVKAPIDAEVVKSKLLQYESNAPSIAIAARILTKGLPDHLYQIKAPLPYGSKQATSLSRQIRDEIAKHIRSTHTTDKDTLLLKGGYEINDNDIVVTVRVVNESGIILNTRVVKLGKTAYANIGYRPTSIDFDKLLHDGYVVSSVFTAKISTNRGAEDLLFTEGETIELLVKLNSPGYFYIVSHNIENASSYLIALNYDSTGKRQFIRYVNADDANKWISLGEFDATAPYGTENLQLIASSIDLISKLPATQYDETTDLHMLDTHSASEAVRKTRALVPKHKGQVRSTEATLSFTTMAK